MTGFVIFAHGSRVESANQAVRDLAERFSGAGGFLAEAAFLEQTTPDLAGAVERLLARGASRVTVIPYFLTLGIHLQRDLPRLVEDVSIRHAGLPVAIAPPLDGHPALLDAMLERAKESA